jgi:predicted amidohydrolase YtcJ
MTLLRVRLCPWALAGLVSVTAAEAGPPKPDLVLTNGVVYTGEAKLATVEAVAITGGRIAAAGTSQTVARLVGPKTQVIDLKGRTVVPGFEDSHAHVLAVGFAHIDVRLVGAKTYAEVVQRVAAAARERKPGEWILGQGWHESKWSEAPADAVRGFPRHEALSVVTPDNPVVLERADGHAVLVNARALEQMAIAKDTAAPAGGEIIHDDLGNPTGVFVDNAQSLIHPPDRSAAENRRALDLAMEEALAKGVTTLTDAGTTTEATAIYREYAAAGKLSVRIYAMASGLATLKEWKEPRVGLGNGFLSLRAVKLYADGAMGSRGAALLEPYDDDPTNSGLLVTPPEGLLEAARWALPRGFQVATHAIGDRANRIVLDQYETAFREFPGAKDHRFRVEHAQLLDAAEIPRFGRLHVIASMQGIHAPSDRPWAPTRVGMARVTEGLYVWRKLWDAGALIVNGTDAPVEDLSPIQNFYASVTRMGFDGQPPGGFDPDQRMTREEALRTYTKDAAYAQFEEKDRGTLGVGKRADLVVLSRDIMKVPESEILGTEVDVTIVDGRVRYERPAGPRK